MAGENESHAGGWEAMLAEGANSRAGNGLLWKIARKMGGDRNRGGEKYFGGWWLVA